MDQDAIKKNLGRYAASLIQDGQTVGLGTGTTAYYFITHLANRCREGLSIHAVASSQASHSLAQELGIPLAAIDTLTFLDITVDGADEIDPQNRLIKGGGGALLREKILATMSRELIIIADHTKLSQRLGSHPLPIEVIPFALCATLAQITPLGLSGTYRLKADGKPYVTDNHNLILDLDLSQTPLSPEEIHARLLQIPSIVDTGFFIDLATTILIGQPDGTITKR